MAEEDLIFGKNRHFFGGIEPSNMKTFKAEVSGEGVVLTAELPDDTVVDGQTLCTVAGAVIRRSSTGYPSDEFDGELVADISESGTYLDAVPDTSSTYLYAAFPYTTQGVYSCNPLNTCGVNLPGNMVTFTAESNYDGTTLKVKLTTDLPNGVEGAVIRKSTSGYPVSETDGEEVMTITADGTYYDTNVVDKTTYYYSAFPYSQGVHNRSEVNRTEATTKTFYIFGYDLDTSDSDPSTRVSYPSDVHNSNYASACMDYSVGSFDYGGWNFAPGEKFMPRPCMLRYDGTVDHYLNPNNYTKKTDGSASSVADTSFGGNAMMEWPKIYTKRWEEKGIYHFRCSDIKVDDSYECWCNYDKNNNQIEHFYTPIYNGASDMASDVTRLRSLSGPTTGVKGTYSEFVDLAKANGDDWYIEVLADHLLIQDLLVMMSKSTDGQTSYGHGAGGSKLACGSMDKKGMFWGSSSNSYGVKVFGMENYWGNTFRHIAGLVLKSKTYYIKITRGTYDGSAATDYGNDNSGYLNTGITTATASNEYYISKMTATKFGRLPITYSGSSTTYECDTGLITATGTPVLMIGGGYMGNTNRGIFYTFLRNSATTSYGTIGTSVSCKPSAST